MPGQQRKAHQEQEQIGERDPLMRHVVAEAGEAGAVLETGEDEFVHDDRGKAAEGDLKRLVMEQRDPEQRQREEDEVDGYSKHKTLITDRLESTVKRVTVTLRYFSAFNQPAISLTAILACCSSLPMVKKPWNWPGKCR